MRARYTLLVLLIAPLALAAEDACAPLIPPALQDQLQKRFSSYRLPRQTDNIAEDIQYAREHSGSACLGVAIGDFDGDGRADYAIGLTAKSGTGALIVVVLTRQNQWDIQELDRWPEGRSRLYVAAEPARSYEMFGDSDAPLEKGGVEKLVCPHSVVVFGATGASGVAYCLTNSAWQHTWISD
jgi:hypothetical protein